MRCPACREGFLQSDQLDDGPAAATCPACAGGFVRSADYHVWLKDHGENLPERPADEQSAMEVVDSGAGKLCPACDRFMTRVKVGHDVPFHLDFCANCGGVWLDAREWDVLRARNLHDEVHLIFTDTWQTGVKQAEKAQLEEQRLAEQFGEADLAELRRIREWIDSHPRREQIQAYLRL